MTKERSRQNVKSKIKNGLENFRVGSTECSSEGGIFDLALISEWDLNGREKSQFQGKGSVKKRHEVVRRPLKATFRVSKTQQKK